VGVGKKGKREVEVEVEVEVEFFSLRPLSSSSSINLSCFLSFLFFIFTHSSSCAGTLSRKRVQRSSSRSSGIATMVASSSRSCSSSGRAEETMESFERESLSRVEVKKPRRTR